MSHGHLARSSNGAVHTEEEEDARRAARDAEEAALTLDQTLSDTDQTSSDADQSASDADQSASESDEALASADQDASDRDQEAAEQEMLEDGPAPGSRKQVHEASTVEREASTAERAMRAVLRAQAASERLDAADGRDEASRRRDLAAEARDRAADQRDRSETKVESDGPRAEARAKAAADRKRAAADRERAAADREQAALDRQHVRVALRQAHFDELTGTYRRGLGTLELQREINRARHSGGRLVLAFADVDGLKDVNDRDGHAAGDALLIDVATTIRSNLRSYDPLVRFGGDEFVCAFSDFNVEGVRGRFEEIQGELSQRRPGCSISVGVAELQRGDTLEDLTARGDADLYKVKRHKGAVRAPGGESASAA